MQWLSRLLRRPPKPPPFTPRNHLERLLVKAAVDPAVRPDFLKAFLDSEVYAVGWVGDEPSKQDGSFVAAGGETLSVREMEHEGRRVIPLFTSPERIAALAPGTSYIGMTARALFATIGAREVLLNPGSSYGKHFLPDEIARLLDGSAFQPQQSWVASKPEEMLIGKPAKVPEKFVAALKTFFARRRDVRRAYLALIHIPSRSEAPNLLVAIDTEGDLKAIAGECGMIAAETLERGEFADIAGTSIAPDYFAHDTPIYSRE